MVKKILIVLLLAVILQGAAAQDDLDVENMVFIRLKFSVVNPSGIAVLSSQLTRPTVYDKSVTTKFTAENLELVVSLTPVEVGGEIILKLSGTVRIVKDDEILTKELKAEIPMKFADPKFYFPLGSQTESNVLTQDDLAAENATTSNKHNIILQIELLIPEMVLTN